MSGWFVAVSVLDYYANDSDHADVHRIPMSSFLMSSIRLRNYRLRHLMHEHDRMGRRSEQDSLRLQGIAR